MTKPIPGRKRAKPIDDNDRLRVIAEHFYAGKRLSEIGVILGLTTTRVSQIIKFAGMERPRLILHPDGVNARKRARAVKRCWAIWGMSREDRAAIVAQYGRMPMYRYHTQRAQAANRGIAWEISFAQWWAIWCESGRWDERGVGSGYCMARHGDVGPYAAWNVSICNGRQNTADMHRNRIARHGTNISQSC